MKKIIFILVCFVAFKANAQVPAVSNPMTGNNYKFYKWVTFDTGAHLIIVTRDTTGTSAKGDIRILPGSSGGAYINNGNYWDRISGTTGASQGLFEVISVNDTLKGDIVINGGAYTYDHKTKHFFIRTTSNDEGFTVDGGNTELNVNRNADVNMRAATHYVIDMAHGDSGGAVIVHSRSDDTSILVVNDKGYILFGGDYGEGGYGFRNITGVNEYKDNGGTWSTINTVSTTAPGIDLINVSAGKLIEKIEVIEPTSISYDIGTTIGGKEIATKVPVTTGHGIFEFNYYATTATTLYFSHLTVNTIIKIYSR